MLAYEAARLARARGRALVARGGPCLVVSAARAGGARRRRRTSTWCRTASTRHGVPVSSRRPPARAARVRRQPRLLPERRRGHVARARRAAARARGGARRPSCASSARDRRGACARSRGCRACRWRPPCRRWRPSWRRVAGGHPAARRDRGSRTRSSRRWRRGRRWSRPRGPTEGLDVRPGEHLLVAEDAAGLAEAAIALLRDPGRARALARAGRAARRAPLPLGGLGGRGRGGVDGCEAALNARGLLLCRAHGAAARQRMAPSLGDPGRGGRPRLRPRVPRRVHPARAVPLPLTQGYLPGMRFAEVQHHWVEMIVAQLGALYFFGLYEVRALDQPARVPGRRCWRRRSCRPPPRRRLLLRAGPDVPARWTVLSCNEAGSEPSRHCRMNSLPHHSRYPELAGFANEDRIFPRSNAFSSNLVLTANHKADPSSCWDVRHGGDDLICLEGNVVVSDPTTLSAPAGSVALLIAGRSHGDVKKLLQEVLKDWPAAAQQLYRQAPSRS